MQQQIAHMGHTLKSVKQNWEEVELIKWVASDSSREGSRDMDKDYADIK